MEPGAGGRAPLAQRALDVVRLHPVHSALHANAVETLAELDLSRCAVGYIPDTLRACGLARRRAIEEEATTAPDTIRYGARA
jgi:hypothetical protein